MTTMYGTRARKSGEHVRLERIGRDFKTNPEMEALERRAERGELSHMSPQLRMALGLYAGTRDASRRLRNLEGN